MADDWIVKLKERLSKKTVLQGSIGCVVFDPGTSRSKSVYSDVKIRLPGDKADQLKVPLSQTGDDGSSSDTDPG